MITLMGSLSAPASAAEVQELPYVYTSSKILTAPRSDRSIPASIAYSHGSGVAPGRLHAVLQGSRSQPLLAAGISADTSSTSAQLTALGSNNALMSVASSSILTQESSPAAEVAGDGRDRVSDVLKVLDRRLDNAISGAQGSALRAIPSLAPSDVDEIKKSRELATEAVELVHQVCSHHLPASFLQNKASTEQTKLQVHHCVTISHPAAVSSGLASTIRELQIVRFRNTRCHHCSSSAFPTLQHFFQFSLPRFFIVAIVHFYFATGTAMLCVLFEHQFTEYARRCGWMQGRQD